MNFNEFIKKFFAILRMCKNMHKIHDIMNAKENHNLINVQRKTETNDFYGGESAWLKSNDLKKYIHKEQ